MSDLSELQLEEDYDYPAAHAPYKNIVATYHWKDGWCSHVTQNNGKFILWTRFQARQWFCAERNLVIVPERDFVYDQYIRR